MHHPSHITPVVTPRAITPREDGRIDLVGLPRSYSSRFPAALSGGGILDNRATGRRTPLL